MNKILITILMFFLGIQVSAHPWKPEHHIIIDTDCGIDDYRTICMLLAASDIRILGMVTSNGVLDAEKGYSKLRNLLADLHHEGILTATSDYTGSSAKNCSTALNFSWGEETTLSGKEYSAKQLVEHILCNTSDPVDYICLGSLNTVAGLYKGSSVFREKVGIMIWSSGTEMNDDNFNYSLDKEAYRFITDSTGLSLKIVAGELLDLKYSTSLIEQIHGLDNAYAKKLYTSLTDIQSPYAKVLFDECVPLYIQNEELFRTDTLSPLIHQKVIFSDRSAMEKCLIQIIKGYSGDQHQVLNKFPLDTSFYQSDVQEIMRSSIEKYGMKEWVSGVITNELHGHLGVYATIGTKMGIRAREYFGAGIDEMKVVSFAGNTPPFSCMNDGLQVSTGATLGHGLIRIASDTLKLPEAEFLYMGRTIRIALKDKYRKRIEGEIKEYRLVYGLTSDMYWELVRTAAIRYWANWNRHEIFSITEEY